MTQPQRKIYPVIQHIPETSEILPRVLPRSPRYLFNRELSLIEFFQRVLDEGLNANQPLLERLKFLGILSSNLDEFFMIRVSSLKEKYDDETRLSADGKNAKQQLKEIKERVSAMVKSQMTCLHEDILPALAKNGIVLTLPNSLNESEKASLHEYFLQKIYPLLTPQAVDPAHPFPYISGGNLNIGLFVKPKVNRRIAQRLYIADESIFMRIEIPQFTERLIRVGENSEKFVLVEDLIIENVNSLIPEAEAENCHIFRIVRDGDIGLREEEASDLLESMEENLKQRRFGETVRLEISSTMPQEMLEYLADSLEISDDDVYSIDGILKVSDLMSLYKIERPELKDEPLQISRPAIFNSKESTFDLIKKGNILLHHPYNPYSIVTDFIAEAAEDENVLAIKMCLYRTGANSPIPPLLIKASEAGKQVTVLIELKARFDEENNIEWAKRLEQSGVHVVYGLLGLKTHCKTTLIMRRENDEIRRYIHLATGNYNPETSAFYTDLGLLTDDEAIGEDATELFNFLTAYTHKKNFKKLLVAPIDLREKMLGFINRETENALNGKSARIVAKMNRLADTEIIRALYAASQAGVRIDLIVRGICLLRPGIKGLSENIRVRSIVGRLLEHSRLYYFENGGNEEVYLGSSDWMPRNLDRRVEVLTPIEDLQLKSYLKNEFLDAYLKDNVRAWILQANGTYERVAPSIGEERFDSQLSFQFDKNVIKFTAKH